MIELKQVTGPACQCWGERQSLVLPLSSLFPRMRPQIHTCSDECYSLLKHGTGNEAEWVLWEAICDLNIYYRMLKHLRRVDPLPRFLGAISYSLSHYAICTSVWNLIRPLSSAISFFSVCVWLSLIFINANADTEWYSLWCPWCISWVNLSHRASSTCIIHPPINSF